MTSVDEREAGVEGGCHRQDVPRNSTNLIWKSSSVATDLAVDLTLLSHLILMYQVGA